MATVLIVEDEDQLRRSLTLYLTCRGFIVAEADTVETAIEALEVFAAPFDVILLDIILPDGTGWDVLRYLRDRAGEPAATSEAPRQPRVIAMTAAQPAECRVDEFELAAILLKPFPMEVLVRLLDRVPAEQPCAEATDRYVSAPLCAESTRAAGAKNQSLYEVDVPRDDVELDVEDAFGDHDIEYWVRHGKKLVPATDHEVDQIRERERDSSALVRLTLWKHRQVRTSSGFARLLRGIASVQQRLGHSQRQLGSGNKQQHQQRSPIKRPIVREHDQHPSENVLQ
jgi:DNA-binding response OmpR family regulator